MEKGDNGGLPYLYRYPLFLSFEYIMAEITKDEAIKYLQGLPDEELAGLAITSWQYSDVSAQEVDADGFPVKGAGTKAQEEFTYAALQLLCWNKFHDNPQVNTSVRGLAGRLAGYGFGVSSENPDIQEVIEEIELDPRNRLYSFWPKYVVRSRIEGELFLCLTCHADGFVEVDFIDPAAITGGDKNDGVVYHPDKASMPLAYFIEGEDSSNNEIILSIFCAHYPELVRVAAETDSHFRKNKVKRSKKKAFRKLNGYYKFIVAWDQSFITRRNVSYLKTVLQWLNFYETLKKYEIDHKRSSGAYVWTITMEDPKAFRLWLGLTDEDKRKTGIMAKKTPGGTLVLPPGMKLAVVNPTLPKISEADTDILHMVTSGLNEAEDVTTGQSKGTFASVKASRGPMSDRISDEVAYFQTYLRYDFWGGIFLLRSLIINFPRLFEVEKAVGWKDVIGDEKREAIFKTVKQRPEQLIDISSPVTEMVDVETRARAFLGVKHGSTYDTLGIPNKVIAEKIGIGHYGRLRLQQAEEEKNYPKLLLTVDDESRQEKVEAEPGRNNA